LKSQVRNRWALKNADDRDDFTFRRRTKNRENIVVGVLKSVQIVFAPIMPSQNRHPPCSRCSTCVLVLSPAHFVRIPKALPSFGMVMILIHRDVNNQSATRGDSNSSGHG
jgi:hypothetical protein